LKVRVFFLLLLYPRCTPPSSQPYGGKVVGKRERNEESAKLHILAIFHDIIIGY
jgi:hypothetical protein